MSGKLKSLLIITAGVTLAGAAAAHEVSLYDVTDYYVQEASTSTSTELHNAVYSDVLNTTHKVQLQENEIETRVLITDKQTMPEDDSVAASE